MVPTMAPYGSSVIPSTFRPRCNFTIGLLNDGAYTARMRVRYVIDGINQPIYTSNELPFIGNRASVTIPFYSTDINVSLERWTGSNWASIKTDTGINTVNFCTKCYKVWNDVLNPRWDYIDC
jgi:hypothetical protein